MDLALYVGLCQVEQDKALPEIVATNTIARCSSEIFLNWK